MDTSRREPSMNNRDKLSNLILTHWQQYHPRMLAQLQQENRLEEELQATAESFDDLMYSLVVEKKMDYQRAWEIAIAEFLLPEEEESSSLTSHNNPPPATSE